MCKMGAFAGVFQRVLGFSAPYRGLLEYQRSQTGCLIFRAGSVARAGERPLSTHTYMSVRPTPGSLWIFPGSVPHVVMGVSRPVTGETYTCGGMPHERVCERERVAGGALSQGAKILALEEERALWKPRISVGMNFQVNAPNAASYPAASSLWGGSV